ncbi:DNA translocase FtsK 4TM domain-containing protein [Candidatus Saccharibacteria bacterium]|nr:DNA translocase FtsK 4TM domain-containing protein [Candidatus Saccharibacteria bacterium]
MPASRRKNTRKSSSAKKSTKKTASKKAAEKEVNTEYELPGGFWHQIMAVLMIALALFFVITWFDHGGSFLNKTHQVILQGLGLATYFIPALLVYLAVKIFRSDNNRVAIPVYIFSILMLLWISGIGAIWNNGGIVGDWLNNIMLKVLDQGFVFVIYMILIFITLAFILQLSPAALFRNTKNITKRDVKKAAKAEDDEENKEKGQLEIKVNSGTPEIVADEAPKRGGFLRRKPKDLTINKPKASKTPDSDPVKEPTALVAVNDPDWKMPSTDLLTKKRSPADAGNIQQNAMIIQNTLAEFGIDVEMKGANVGPRVTQYTLKAPGGVNLSKISARDKELAYKLSAKTVRIEAPIPGTQLIGVEVPNIRAEGVSLRGLIESEEWRKTKAPLTFAVGKDISGKPVVADLADMRHLLIAGTTGSGKSVMTNTLIMSLLYRNAPSDMRLIIVDPKRVEMAVYKDIPHLLTPIINDTTKALSAMKWAAGEMDRRYTIMEEAGVKTIVDYNNVMSEKAKSGSKDDGDTAEKMPYIVIVIDEMSDLMMQASKELEPLIVRIAQLGRAAGMHLVLATQKPVVKVITGLIKGNIPSRIAFRVLSSMDSRIILDSSGAEKLLGQGDMLLSSEQTSNGPERIQGAWTPDSDIKKVTDFLRSQRPPQYNEEVIAQAVAIKGMGGGLGDMDGLGRKFDPQDPLVRKAIEICIKNGKFSTSLLQTYLSKSHGYVSGLGVWLEELGVIGPVNGTKPRELLITSMEEFDELASA